MRLTRARILILRALFDNPADLSSSDLMQALRMGPGTVYPALIAFEAKGLVESYWDVTRLRRRLYHLTTAGVTAYRAVVEAVPR